MTSILTGDIINSKELSPKKWMKSLKQVLNDLAKENSGWEIYRGDSFQLEVLPELALEAVIRIKAAIKQYKDLDVRIAIGIGDKTYTAKRITESNGTAFVNSGECFETLKKSTLAIKTANTSFDYTMNMIFQLASLVINNWTVNSSILIKTVLENPKLNQKELSKLLDKSQSNISEGLTRSGYDEILQLLVFYKHKIKNIR